MMVKPIQKIAESKTPKGIEPVMKEKKGNKKEKLTLAKAVEEVVKNFSLEVESLCGNLSSKRKEDVKKFENNLEALLKWDIAKHLKDYKPSA